ncbi:MAG: hypothetical protein COX20_09215 [Desulfobacterales bacterium CG23_combo_of_CG06-09_8_20_14_all_52_9]|nr:MAG: hypothetical protein COX20_09215 [Desulfobacterales bacterium CG23_combo_of_CG06-09_8_20_14_all_52_9]
MQNYLAEILRYLETDNEMNKLRDHVLDLCVAVAGAKQIVKEMEEDIDLDVEHRGFYYLFKACAHHELKEFAKAIDSAVYATSGMWGSKNNKAFVYWILGLIRRDDKNPKQARKELKKSIRMLGGSKITSSRKDTGDSEFRQRLINDINLTINKLPQQPQDTSAGAPPVPRFPLQDPLDSSPPPSPPPTTQVSPPTPPISIPPITFNVEKLVEVPTLTPHFHFPSAPAPAPNYPLTQPWPTAQIVYRVQDFSHASREGKFVLDNAQISEMSIDEVKFDDITHKIYNLREGSQIRLVSGGNYRWLKVAGESMNRATPVPIEPGDYILTALDITPQIEDIVIANLHNPPTPAERAGVVKRYNSDGFKSESTEILSPIPLTEADIRGVVFAVAKPV